MLALLQLHANLKFFDKGVFVYARIITRYAILDRGASWALVQNLLVFHGFKLLGKVFLIVEGSSFGFTGGTVLAGEFPFLVKLGGFLAMYYDLVAPDFAATR